MDFLLEFLKIILHIDQYLAQVFAQYGTWTYLILFTVIFCETGLVVTPFLPGDSLLFATGALAGGGYLDPHLCFGLLASAAILGDTTNYWVGRALGPAVFERNTRFLNKKHLSRAHEFYERHGGKTIIFARFAPILRTFAPFVAGVASMPYLRFLCFSVTGGLCWIGAFVYAGFFFGELEVVKKNFSLVVVAIILISLLPAAIEFFKQRAQARKA